MLIFQIVTFKSNSLDHIQGMILESEEEISMLKKQKEEYEEKIEELVWSEQLLKKANNQLLDALDKEAEKVEQLTAQVNKLQQGNN